ncbi:hypothetical protein [Frankia sp. R82]
MRKVDSWTWENDRSHPRPGRWCCFRKVPGVRGRCVPSDRKA